MWHNYDDYLKKKEGRIVRLTKSIGSIIDERDRNKYQLFPDVDGFKSASVYKMPDNNYIVVIKSTNEAMNKEVVQFVPMSEMDIEKLRKQINLY